MVSQTLLIRILVTAYITSDATAKLVETELVTNYRQKKTLVYTPLYIFSNAQFFSIIHKHLGKTYKNSLNEHEE